MNTTDAISEVLLLQAETSNFDKVDAMAYFSNQGLPLEVVTRISCLWEKTLEIGGQVLNIGKIIIMKLIKFITDNPSMVIGMAIGVGLGVLVAMIPIIGQFIAPVVTAIAITWGALHGHRLDKVMRGEYVGNSLIEDAITIAKQFWMFLFDIIDTLVLEFYVMANKQ